jgi:Kef-type K+ transport system membrane component KefB
MTAPFVSSSGQVLSVLGGLATLAKSEAVLPAYLIGLMMAGNFIHDQVLTHRMRSIAFTLLTPFYFIKAGLFVSLPAVASAGLIVILFLVKMVTKLIGVYPATALFHFNPREGAYTTAMMATGLTFGTISALFGLTNHIIDQTQYTMLVTVVIMSAVIPTLIGQAFFEPRVGLPISPFQTVAIEAEEELGPLAEETRPRV